MTAIQEDTRTVTSFEVDAERLARARHRWQHPTFAFGQVRCGCEGWAATIVDMLELLAEDEARAALEGTSRE